VIESVEATGSELPLRDHSGVTLLEPGKENGIGHILVRRPFSRGSLEVTFRLESNLTDTLMELLQSSETENTAPVMLHPSASPNEPLYLMPSINVPSWPIGYSPKGVPYFALPETPQIAHGLLLTNTQSGICFLSPPGIPEVIDASKPDPEAVLGVLLSSLVVESKQALLEGVFGDSSRLRPSIIGYVSWFLVCAFRKKKERKRNITDRAEFNADRSRDLMERDMIV